MNSLTPCSRSSISRSVARVPRPLLLVLSTASILLASVNVFGVTNHPPTVSWIRDQALSDQPGQQNSFETVYFRAWDKETDPLSEPTATIEYHPGSPAFLTAVNIDPCLPSEAGCPQDHGFKLTIDPLMPEQDGAATIVIKATDGGGASTSSSFTLRKQHDAINPPVIAGIPAEQIQMNSTLGYGPVWFVVSDLDTNGVEDSLDSQGNPTIQFDKLSDNPTLVSPLTGISITHTGGTNALSYLVTVLPNTNQFGRAVITIIVTDPDGFKTSTSFVLDVTSGSNTPPSFTPAPSPSGTWIEHDVTQSQYIVYNFKVTDAQNQTPKRELLVTATSSNANLVPNDTNHLMVSAISNTGSGTLRITPMLPLPSPSPGVPQAATITLSVTDNAYTRRKQFLYVAKNPNSAARGFSRPTGVYNLDPKDLDDHRPDDTFLTGEMRRIAWFDLETGDNEFNWQALDDAVAALPAGQDLSLNLMGEPCYIADQAEFTWCDTNNPIQQQECTTTCTGGVKRALPWDSVLQQKRARFLQQLAQHVIPATGHTVANEPLIPIINPNLPGGNTGIRELNEMPFDDYDLAGYSRAALRGAVQTELRAVVQHFPTKLIHIGFFTVEDDLNDQYFGESLWHWLYPQLTNEFNGTRRPRVHFFQEDLAAARASAALDYIPYLPQGNNTTAYSFFPNHCQVPSFAFTCSNTGECDPLSICPPTNSEYNNGITFQANTPWSSPFAEGDKVTKTLNGTPNDGMEAAFNSYLNEYLEVYRGDLDHAQAGPTPPPPTTPTPTPWDHNKWKEGLQSWKDYCDHLREDPLDAPAGVTVARESATSNTVSWYGVYRATCYTLERKSLSPPANWTNVSGCDPASTTCTDTASTGSRYAYRVQASNADGTLLSPWAQVAVFLSESNNDGYVSTNGETYTPFNNVTGPGIQAGQGAGMDLSGFLSFDTSSLGSAATVLHAKLRLKQYSNNDGFDALGPCIADIRKGDFNDWAELEGADFDALETDCDVTEEGELAGVDSGNWVEAELDPLYVGDVNNTDRTQFRLWFEHIEGLNDKSVQWYSSESAGNEPQLIVQYTEP